MTDYISIERAHTLLGLSRPARGNMIAKQDIHQAYRQAAKRHHPDAQWHANATPCPVKFRQVGQARETLLHYYYQNPGIQMRRAAKRTDPEMWNPALHHLKYKKYTMGIKFVVLILVSCDGIMENWQKNKTTSKTTTR